MASSPAPIRRTDGRTRLLDAAAKLFAHGGYDEVSVAEILAESGLKAPSLYHHFKDKEGLYTAWAAQALDKLNERLQAAAKAEAPREGLRQALSALVVDPELDLLQLKRDLRLLRDPEAQSAMATQMEFSVLRPIQKVLERCGASQDSMGAGSAAALLIHASSFLHPAYRTEDPDIADVDALLEWIRVPESA